MANSKEYWISKMHQIMDGELNRLVNSNKELVEKAKTEAIKAHFAKYPGSEQLAQQIKDTETAWKDAQEKVSELYKELGNLSSKFGILTGSNQYYHGNGYGNTGFNNFLENQAKSEVYDCLMKQGPVGIRMAWLQKARNQLEMNFMLATTSKAVVDLVNKLCEEFALKLS